MTTQAAQAKRFTKSPLAAPEKRLLIAIASRIPRAITPDHLSLLALVAAAGIAASYALSNRNPAWLWAASAGLILHWLGDSLDGTLARVRHTERPRYGFYVDHLADAISTVALGLGLGFSPYMLLSVGLAVVVAYLVLSINVYLETLVVEQFRLGYGILGPTEARILLIALNTVALLAGPVPFRFLGVGATIYDVAGVLAAAAMVGLLLRRIVRNMKNLGELEPANVVHEQK